MKGIKISRRKFIGTMGMAMAAKSIVPDKGIAAGNPPSSYCIDCQSHIFIPEIIDLMKRRKEDPSIYEKEGAVWIKMGDWHRKLRPTHMDIEAKLAAMDANAINLTALSTNDPGPEWFGEEGAQVALLMNNYIAGITKKYPDRFIGLIVLPLQDREAAESELRRCVLNLGMRGILLYTNLAGSWPDEPQYRWLFEAALQYDLPILLHPAKPTTTEQIKGYNLTSTLGNMFENTISLARIIASGLLDDYPDLKLVCPHLGGTLPYIAGRFDHQVTVLKRSNQTLNQKPSDYMRQIYFDIVSPLPEAMRFALDFTSADRLLFSSDHPWVDPALIRDCLKGLELKVQDEEKILGGNARRLFNL